MSETDEEKLEWLRRAVQKGLDDLEAGGFCHDPTVMAELRKKLFKLKAEQDMQVKNDQTL